MHCAQPLDDVPDSALGIKILTEEIIPVYDQAWKGDILLVHRGQQVQVALCEAAMAGIYAYDRTKARRGYQEQSAACSSKV